MNNPWHNYVMAVMYIVAGIMHFIKPKIYMRVMPNYLPEHRFLVYLSGVAEIVLGIGMCYPVTAKWSLYGIILMLIVFLMVHFYMLSGEKASAGIPKWILILRIPLQFGLMYWAYWYLNELIARPTL
ncbi:MauE/DoxX family redox-associated membrane protein [Psychroserpens sp.]|uniref:DoxX family protein n=1 Tax=Psychroserpens sp. TaxID=2020870 RepID=UPI001B04D8B3|nr:MauE/DoxX family redox-associated membrane protein [Psychroserpens sp.]MBO6606860.1 DoxX family protein [Psychroserpens sp.]MBO6630369.1 DoxX family protein [Psychroserpens sp.]MBO6654006.1 DoxX family protein [Psychroserpens sp.]MBO6682708.1 DoxX family protein [Psychroserpens sp.]MBO6750632.1 DoxX family protein [Psychroserpens sp.]